MKGRTLNMRFVDININNTISVGPKSWKSTIASSTMICLSGVLYVNLTYNNFNIFGVSESDKSIHDPKTNHCSDSFKYSRAAGHTNLRTFASVDKPMSFAKNYIKSKQLGKISAAAL
jgi:hypothetical protein